MTSFGIFLKELKLMRLGKFITIFSIALMYVAYSQFLPMALSSDQLPDYIKNHFVREIIFGIALSVIVIVRTCSASSQTHVWKIGVLGSIVVLPFWVATVFGWSTDGLAEVWGEKIKPDAVYILHGTQVVTFYLGLVILKLSIRDKMP